MNKLMTVGMTAVLATGLANAQNDMVMVGQAPVMEQTTTEVTAEAALMTAYVWRGQVLNNDMVFQPQITVSHANFSVNVWGNYDLGKNVAGNQSEFSEMDISLAYTIPLEINDFAFDVGVINYNFPGNEGTSIPSTTEIFASAHLLTFSDYVLPSVTMFGDIDEADGTYILFDIVAPYQVSEYLSVEAGASAGWGNTSYNDYYWGGVPTVGGGDQDEGFNDYNLYANASYELMENVTASANVTFTFLEGGSIRNAADVIYENDQKLWAGVNIAYDF